MADTDNPEITQQSPAGGIPFEAANDYTPDIWGRKPSVMEMRQTLDEVKPKSTGEALSLGVSKYLLDQRKNFEGVKDSTEQVANRMLAQRSDVLNEINTQEVEPPDDKAEKELKKQKAEFTRELKSRYDIPADQIKEGVILPVPKGYKSDYLEGLGVKHPAWAKQYIQLRKNPDTGELSWQGYNKPSVIEGETDATVYSTKFKDEGFTENTDPSTGMKTKVPTKDVQAFWDREYNNPDYTPGATRAVGLLRNMESAGNYRVSKLMAKNPELWDNFKKEAENITGQDINEQGAMQAAEKAIAKTYKMDQPVSSVSPHTSEWAIMDAINKQNDFVQYTKDYTRQMDNLSAKIRLAGESALYTDMKPQFDKLHEIEGQMLRDPASVTPKDQKLYNQLKLEITSKTIDATKESPLSTAFNTNAAEYKKKYNDHVRDAAILGTEDGQNALTLLSHQAEGYQLSQRLADYFPGVKAAQKEQGKIDEKGDKFSVVKSFLRGMRGATESFRAGGMRMMGFTEEGIGSEISGEKKSELDLRTPVRDNKSVWNNIANFSDETAEFMGNMAPYIAVTAATGGAGAADIPGFIMREGIPFFASGYNDYYREAKGQGLKENDAQLKGILGGAALTLSQRFVPKGQLLDRGLINKEIASLVEAGSVDKNKLVDFFSKFVTGAAHGEAAVVVNGMADMAMNSYENATKGTHFATDQLSPEHLGKTAAMFGIQASIMNGLARTGNKDAARAMVVKASETHPLTTLRAIDDALTLSKTDKTYDGVALQRMKSEVSEAVRMQFPADFSLEQRVATFDLVKKKQELKAEEAAADPEFKESYSSKIKYIDDELKKIADKQSAAEKHLDNISDPLYKQMESEGYFEQPAKEKAGKAEVVKPEAKIMARNGETDANRVGTIGNEEDPLTDKGTQQAAELGTSLAAQGVKHVITAPAERSVQTADIIAEKTGGDVVVNPKLREWRTGGEGEPSSTFDEKYFVNHPDEAPEGGESFNQFLNRVQGARGELEGINKETAIVTHGKVLRLLTALDKNGGEWNEKAKAEYLKDRGFENGTAYQGGKEMGKVEAKTEEVADKKEPTHDERIAEKFGGRKVEDIVKEMKESGLLKVKCPPAGKTKVSLRNMKRA